MAGNKIFYVTRTETEGQPAGAATLHRGDKPQLLKIVGVDHAGNPDPTTPEDNQIYATEEENQEILFTSDTVQSGDYNPVTSDAVATYVRNQNILSDWETITPTSSNPYTYTAPYDGIIAFDNHQWTSTNNLGYVLVNGVGCNNFGQIDGGTVVGQHFASMSVTVKKGDVVTSTTNSTGWDWKARWYKLRDYSDRS